jgi:hypothetical protein
MAKNTFICFLLSSEKINTLKEMQQVTHKQTHTCLRVRMTLLAELLTGVHNRQTVVMPAPSQAQRLIQLFK